MPSTISGKSSFVDRSVPLLLGLLALVFSARSVLTHRVFNDTADEAVHINCGLELWQWGRYRSEPQHPPLARALLALPPYLAGLRYDQRHAIWDNASRDFYWRTLSLARTGNLVFVPFLLVYVYLWGRRMSGATSGLAAAALVSLSPNLLAHASLATLDFGAATTIFIAAYYLWRWSLEPTRRLAVAAGVCCALAVLTKFSALVVLPPIGVGFLALARRRPRLDSAGMALGIALLLVWAGYGFDVGGLEKPQFLAPEGTRTQRIQAWVETTDTQSRLPAPGLVRGLLDVAGHNAQGHACYLLGRLGQYGWWYYFPVALAVKTTLPLLALAALGLLRRPSAAVLGAAILVAVAMPSNLNLGVRHILAVYPLLALAAAPLFASGRRALLAAALALAGWHGVESVRAHPDYLAYFNQVARGREEAFLLDSNLDWGQDLERLRIYLDANQVSEVHLSYFGRADPARFGIRGLRRLPPDLRPSGWVAVSKAHIAGLALQGYNLGWLRAHRPVARIGYSILVYRFDP